MNDCLFKPLSLTLLGQWIGGITPASPASVFDLQSLCLLTGSNPAQTRRLLVELLKSSRLDRQELLTLSPADDREGLTVVAHKIKGAARIAQASRLIECCDALEDACQQALPSLEIGRRWQATSQAMLELEQALQHQLALADQGTVSES
jgi:two-component system sensor histidine kinase EvgS